MNQYLFGQCLPELRFQYQGTEKLACLHLEYSSVVFMIDIANGLEIAIFT
jgi:hypothetical protein